MNQHKRKLALVNRFFSGVFIYAGFSRAFWVRYSDMGIGLERNFRDLLLFLFNKNKTN